MSKFERYSRISIATCGAVNVVKSRATVAVRAERHTVDSTVMPLEREQLLPASAPPVACSRGIPTVYAAFLSVLVVRDRLVGMSAISMRGMTGGPRSKVC